MDLQFNPIAYPMLKIKNKKAQVNGLVTGLIFGVAGLVIGVIIAFVIVSTLLDADLFVSSRDSVSVLNETGSLNADGYNLTARSLSLIIPDSFVITSVLNATNGSAIPATDYSVNNGLLRNISTGGWDSVNISYTYILYSPEEASSDAMAVNFTLGVDEVSSKLPTILLVAAIVLILGVLALLVAVWQRMRLGGGSTI